MTAMEGHIDSILTEQTGTQCTEVVAQEPEDVLINHTA